MKDPLKPLSFTRTLRLKVRAEAHAWLNAAVREVNHVFNYCNETSLSQLRKRISEAGIDAAEAAA